MSETFLPVDEFEVASWSPGKDGEGVPPTQVHLLYRVKSHGALFVLRLKSKEVADSLINALIEHRDHVWGEGQK